MTYAQAWNQSWRGALPEGPVFIEVSGLYDEDEEMYAKMDVEEDVEINATALRAVLHGLKQERDSNWRIAMAEPDASSRELDETMAMDIDFQTWGDGQPSYLVLDTNVLLSYLDLLASFASHFGKMDASPVLFFVPAVVLQELDGLKKDDGKLGMLARKANQWLLEEARQKNRTGRGIVRGQHQGMMFRGQTRKGRYDERSNDDIILESCVFLAATHRLPPGKVVLLSADRNLCAKCELEGKGLIMMGSIKQVLLGY
ncbi:hypothetical protein BOTBODRAFT_327271 [Botryobasidium botryosum FD-172 SS1]|uniref:PIN domain-containing protein n=1 Tax=Botryobasidium botryosum (strain FD-172 SS1) TaxID=930990 RepID=A0A067N258_BOTB1|nr:hypothetical protein BOTBODRAFT_327271 [Botryobasidium botryosum FD-172 SS1]